MKEELLKLVNAYGPIKNSQIFLLYKKEYEKSPDERIFPLLDELVKDGEIVGLEYVLAGSSSCIRNMYFPKDTQLKVV